MQLIAKLYLHLRLGDFYDFASMRDQLGDCLERVQHDVPCVPEEGHVLVNTQLVQAVAGLAKLSFEVLRALIPPRVDAAILTQFNLIVTVLYLEAPLCLLKR